MRQGLTRFLAAVAIVAVILLIAIFALTNTDRGREQIRKRALAMLENSSHGIIRIGRVTGNLLNGFTLHDLVITDSAGAPFVTADEASARYTLRSLTSQRVEFDDVKLVRAMIVLDRQPGGRWNWDRIFPRDTLTPRGRRKTGWGTWIRFTDVSLVDVDLTVRSPWEPRVLTGAEKSDVVREALGPEGRLVLVEVPGGYQKISKFHHINAKLPLLRLEDPGFRTRRADVASLSMLAEPFRPPTVEVRSLVGGFDFTGDSVWWQNVNATLPGSKLRGGGLYRIDNNDMTLRAHADPVAAADMRWVYPRLPERGSGTLDFAMDWVGDTSIYIARNADVRVADAHLLGDLGMTVAEDFTLHDTNVRFTGLDTRLIQQMFPLVKPSRSGILAGRAKLDGNQKKLAVDGDVTFDDRRAGRNRVIAVGEVGFGNGVFRADNLRLTMRPVQVDLAHDYAPTLPIHGTITGTATLNGSTASRMTARADITHVDRGATSRITGTGAIRSSPGAKMASSWFDVDARVHPLSLITAGRFFPQAGLRGDASGPVRLTGTMRDLSVRTDLGLSDGGSVGLTGKLDLASREKGYDVDLVARLFNANTIMAKAPRTSINATASAEGRGFDPATMRATLVADARSSTYDTLSLTSATVRLAAANGMARVDTLAVDLGQSVAAASGTFGLARGISGQLRYHVAVDSLNRLASLLPPVAEEAVQPRPGILAGRMARVRSDSTKEAKATEVERAALGRAPPTLAPVDTPRTLSISELSGSLRADGVATGNIRDFGLNGTASGENIIARGSSIQRFRATYDWTNALTPQSHVDIDASASKVLASGFDLDSVQTRITYRKPLGTAKVVVVQNQTHVYSLDADYLLNKVRNDLRLNRMELRFDTTVWASVRPSTVHWGQAGVDIDKLEMRNQSNGRIYVDGLIPKEGRANVEVAVDNFAVQDLIALTQSDINASGLVSFNVKAAGTAADPIFSGSFGTERFYYNGTLIPEVHGIVSYANQTLTGRADAMRDGEAPILFAHGTIPINLALTGVTGSRLPRDRQIDLAIRADSLPLDLLPQINTIVTNLKGRAVADFKVNGTLNRPEVTGRFDLDSAEARFVPLGLNLKRMDASVRMLRDTIVVDSLVAWSGGRIVLTGGLGIGSLRAPSFDLKLFVNNATVLDSDQGKLRANMNLAMTGPFSDTHVGGTVRILDGVLYIPKSEGKKIIGTDDPALFSVLDTAIMANREIFPAQSPLLANLRMDVDLLVDRDVFVRSPDFNIEVYSDGDLAVHVNRAKESLVLDGVLLSERGEYRFLSKRFDINRGSATFVNLDEINPTLQVTGGYEVRLPAREAINIKIIIGGTLRNPQIALESDAQPPIPQSDLLSYLAFGRSSSSLLQLEGSGLAASDNLVGAGAALASRQLAAVALGVFTDQLAGEAARSLGADVFNIAPADVQTDIGTFLRGTEIEFGKYIKSHTFVAAQVRPDPAALKRPGLLLQHRFGGLRGYSMETSFQPRYLLKEPSLDPQNPTTTSVFSLFLIRNWRF
ncbi:MAG: translocation/assembly module TamB domain-containing protein [Gemmatimonadaceae bacterium]|nr:translocation/assembly module TamB domain-containing protein [Gemmatimonadaceae bacterium]